ncbi:helix-turn-helix transcriptional regulator [Pseudomonas sp. LB-090624]|uniref:helix-turn-helix transcriptional regulator n=1 Tax=Pseudomonas sp. LB-090624 TaxID=2213079 RepID=UPI0035320A36
MPPAEHLDHFLRLDRLLHLTRIGRHTVYRGFRKATFPKQVKIRAIRLPGASDDQSVH